MAERGPAEAPPERGGNAPQAWSSTLASAAPSLPAATFRLMAEAMPQLVWSATPDGYHDFFNARWYDFTGMPRPGTPGGEGEIPQGWYWKDYLHPGDVERAAAAWTRSVQAGQPYEIRYRLKDAATGAFRWFLGRAVPLHDEAGHVVRWVGTATDVDEAKHAEDALTLLADAGTLLGATLAVEPALAAVAKLVVPALADWCTVDMAELGPDGTVAARRVAVEHVDPSKVALARELAERYPEPSDAPSGVQAVLRTGRPELVAEIPRRLLEATARDAAHLAALESLGLCSYIVVPILDAVGALGGAVDVVDVVDAAPRPDRPRVLGAITFVSAESARRYDARDVGTATELARRAALAIERARLYTSVVRDRERLTEQSKELTVQNEQLQQQAAELEMQAAQLHDQASALEIAHEQLQQQTVELEVSQEQLQQQAAELDVTNRQLTAVLEQSPMGITVAEAPSGRFLLVNRRTHAIFGHTARSADVESYGADWRGFHVEGPRAGQEVLPHEWPMAQAVERGEPVDGQIMEIVQANGHRVQVRINAAPVRDASGLVVAGVSVFDDVTAERQSRAERERLLDELGTQRARLADMFRQAPAFICVLSGPSHVFELTNDAYQQLVGFRDLIGKPVAEALPEVRDQGFIELLDRVLATGEPFVGAEVLVRLQRRANAAPEERYVNFVYQPLLDAAGQRSGIFVHGVDVTEQARARVEVDRARADANVARDRAEEANRAKSEFLAAMSHELRTPLNAIGGYAELMELGVRGPVTEAQLEDLARIRRSQRHLLTLINDILNFARIEGGRIEYDVRPVALAGLVADVAPMIEPQIAAQGLGYDVRLPTGPDTDTVVRADQEKVRQILLNLLSNAVKFTPAGGHVHVEMAADPARPDVALLRISDTGIGIPSEKLEAIFDAFVQVNAGLTRRHEGTGLGLAISRDLARGMGGDLTVESEVGVGSTFTLALPRA